MWMPRLLWLKRGRCGFDFGHGKQRADEIRTRYHISPGSAAYSYASKMALQIGGFNLPEAGVGEPIEVPTKVLLSMHEESSKRRKVDKDVQDGVVAAYLHDRDATTREKVLSNTIKQKRKEKAIKWNLPLPKVRIVAGEDEMCRGVRTGLSIGASNNMCTIRSLVAALCFHQFFEGMGLGSCILQADYKMKMKGILVFFFSETTPLRIAFGILIPNTKDDEEKIQVQLKENAIRKETRLRNVSSVCSILEMDDFELTKLLDRPRLTIKRDKSFDERSLSDMSISRGLNNLDIAYSPDGRSGLDTSFVHYELF
ncbi:probable alkaline/neutral invertase D [Tanacetum coccineum]